MSRHVFFLALLQVWVLFVVIGCAKPGSTGPDEGATAGAGSEKPFENSLGMRFVPVAGTRVLFSVWDTRVADYQAFVLATAAKWPRVDFEQGSTHPAVNVSWLEAKKFCLWLTEKERSGGTIGVQGEYRLPTDMEWSAAAGLPAEEDGTPAAKSGRIGGVYAWGREWPPPRGAGNYCDITFFKKYEQLYQLNSESYIHGYDDGYGDTSPVGAFHANRFGLYDLSGNVWQWCEDWYDGAQTERVLRGASFTAVDPNRILLTFRYHLTPDNRYVNYGFRCVLAEIKHAPDGSF